MLCSFIFPICNCVFLHQIHAVTVRYRRKGHVALGTRLIHAHLLSYTCFFCNTLTLVSEWASHNPQSTIKWLVFHLFKLTTKYLMLLHEGMPRWERAMKSGNTYVIPKNSWNFSGMQNEHLNAHIRYGLLEKSLYKVWLFWSENNSLEGEPAAPSA